MLNFPSAPTPGTVFSSGPTWVWDGVKWKAAAALDAVSTFTPISGATIILTNYDPVFINNAAILAALTIRLPPAIANGFVGIGFLKPVTALSVRDTFGVVVPTAPTNAYGPGAALYFRYVTRWEYWK